MMGVGLLAVGLVGVLMGVAVCFSRAYRYALMLWICVVQGAHLGGIDGTGATGDSILILGWLLVSFGATRGLVGLVELERRRKDG